MRPSVATVVIVVVVVLVANRPVFRTYTIPVGAACIVWSMVSIVKLKQAG